MAEAPLKLASFFQDRPAAYVGTLGLGPLSESVDVAALDRAAHISGSQKEHEVLLAALFIRQAGHRQNPGERPMDEAQTIGALRKVAEHYAEYHTYCNTFRTSWRRSFDAIGNQVDAHFGNRRDLAQGLPEMIDSVRNDATTEFYAQVKQRDEAINGRAPQARPEQTYDRVR